MKKYPRVHTQNPWQNFSTLFTAPKYLSMEH